MPPSSTTSSINLNQILLKLLYKLHLFRDFNFYADYFTALKEIQSGTSRWTRRLRTAQAVLYYGALHGALLALFQDQLPLLANILLFNNMYLIGFNQAWNYVLGAFSLLGARLYQLMYRENVGISAAILYGILIKQSNEAFLWRYRAPVREVWRKFGGFKGGGRSYKLQSNAHFIQWVAVYVRVSLQGSLLLIVFQASSIQLIVWRHLYAMTTPDNGHLMLLALAYFELASSFSLLMMRAFFHVMILTMAFALLVIYVGALQMEQFYAFSGTISTRRQLKRFHGHSVFALQFLTDVSRIYGLALFGACLVAVPTVAMGLIQLLFTRDISLSWKVVMYIAGGLCGLVVFACHFYGAYLTLLMKRPAKRMLALYVHSYTRFPEKEETKEVTGEESREFSQNVVDQEQEEQRRRSTLSRYAQVFAGGGQCKSKTKKKRSGKRVVKWFELNDWRTRFRLAMHIETFFSNSSPTLTYGRYGKVTYVSFGRELYYFFKILTFGYKVFTGM